MSDVIIKSEIKGLDELQEKAARLISIIEDAKKIISEMNEMEIDISIIS